MKKRSRDINIFSMSTLDLFACAMGAFILIAVVLFPYYLKSDPKPPECPICEECLICEECEVCPTYQFPPVDVVIVLDTTGSMGDAIYGLATEIENLTKILEKLSPSVAIGVIGFNDRRQTPTIQTHFDLQEVHYGSSSMNMLQDALSSITPGGAATGRNTDIPEALDAALDRAIQSRWREKAEIQMIIAVTDAPPYPDKEQHVLAGARNFATNPKRSVSGISVGKGRGSEFLKALAEIGRGTYSAPGGSITGSILLSIISGS